MLRMVQALTLRYIFVLPYGCWITTIPSLERCIRIVAMGSEWYVAVAGVMSALMRLPFGRNDNIVVG